MEKGLSKITPSKQTGLAHDEFYAQLLTVIVLFCASGTGIYGSLESGMTGDASILISNFLCGQASGLFRHHGNTGF